MMHEPPDFHVMSKPISAVPSASSVKSTVVVVQLIVGMQFLLPWLKATVVCLPAATRSNDEVAALA